MKRERLRLDEKRRAADYEAISGADEPSLEDSTLKVVEENEKLQKEADVICQDGHELTSNGRTSARGTPVERGQRGILWQGAILLSLSSEGSGGRSARCDWPRKPSLGVE